MLYQKVGYTTPDAPVIVCPQSTGGGALGSALFITPRSFTYNTYAGPGIYDLPGQGLVCFFAADPLYPSSPPALYSDGGYRVVTKAGGAMDMLPFAQAMAAVCIYGGRDNGATFAARQTAAKFRKLEMQCGDTIEFATACASLVGLSIRTCELLTAGTPNGLDDGHVACEIKDASGNWKFFDIANDMYFADGSGNHLSFAEVMAAGVANCVPVKLARSECANPDPVSTKTPYRPLWELLLSTPQGVAGWQARIFQMPGIVHTDGLAYFYVPEGLEGREAWLTGLSSTYRVVPRATWLSMFY